MNAGDAKAALRLVSSNPHPVPASGPYQPAPLQPGTPPARVGLPAGGKWARYAGKLGAALTVTASAASIRKGGREPNEPDDADVDLLQEALEEGLRLKYGEHDVPWWLGAALAAGGVYAGMRIGAKKVDQPDAPETDDRGALKPDAGPPPGQAPAPKPVQKNRMDAIMPKPMGAY